MTRLLLLSCLAGLTACADDPASTASATAAECIVDGEASEVQTYYIDADGDGQGGEAVEACVPGPELVTAEGDCDDADPSRYAGAPERCNGVDDDCDGAIDEEPVDGQIWAEDADGDGLLGVGVVFACTAPAGYGPLGGEPDCDDQDPSAGAGTPTAWFEDLDGDGYGGGTPTFACDPPAGLVADGDDCDDTEALIHPGRIDACDDVDDNCDGIVDDLCLDVEVSVDGDDNADVGPAASLKRALERAEQRALPYVQSRIRVGPGTFQHGPVECAGVDGAGVDGVEVREPVILEGAGRDLTTLRFCVHRDTPSIRVISRDVELRDLTLDVELEHSLSDGVHEGGRGEYGTGITLGRYLSADPHEPVTGVSIERVGIHRTGYTAAALTLVGRVSDVVVRDVLLGGSGRHSTGVIFHWGAHSSLAPAPYVIGVEGYDVFTSYHPHDILVEDVVAEDVVTRMLVVSSAYNLTLTGFRGRTGEFLTMLPGDEIDLHAHPDDKGRIYENIHISDLEADVFFKANEHVARLTSVGTSKIDGEKRILPAVNFVFEGVRVLSVDRALGKFRYGINAQGLVGPARLAGLELGDIGAEADDPSYGVYLRDGEQITVDGLVTAAQTGVGIIDSTDALVRDATLSWGGGGTIDSRGLYVVDTDDAEDQGNSTPVTVTLEDVEMVGHDVSARWVGMTCDDVSVTNVATGGAPEENLVCLL